MPAHGVNSLLFTFIKISETTSNYERLFEWQAIYPPLTNCDFQILFQLLNPSFTWNVRSYLFDFLLHLIRWAISTRWKCQECFSNPLKESLGIRCFLWLPKCLESDFATIWYVSILALLLIQSVYLLFP